MQKVRLMLANECDCNVWPLHSITLKTLGVYNIFESGDEFSSLLVFWTISDIAQWFVFWTDLIAIKKDLVPHPF